MSKFTYKNVDINTITNFKNNIVNSYFNLNATIVPSTSIVTNIDESISPQLSYSINNTDISTYSIANFIESTSGSYSTLPSWCTSIRAVLIGGGAGGNSSQIYQQTHTVQNNSGYNNPTRTNRFHHNVTRQFDTAYSGTGGGGGAFIYISSIPNVQSFTVTAGGAGAPATNGGSTTLQTVTTTGQFQFVAGGGLTTGGGTIQGTATASGDGSSGQGGGQLGGYVGYNGDQVQQTTTISNGGIGGLCGTHATYQTSLYGAGGNGGNANQNSAGPTAGTAGQTGYYRIYFLI